MYGKGTGKPLSQLTSVNRQTFAKANKELLGFLSVVYQKKDWPWKNQLRAYPCLFKENSPGLVTFYTKIFRCSQENESIFTYVPYMYMYEYLQASETCPSVRAFLICLDQSQSFFTVKPPLIWTLRGP